MCRKKRIFNTTMEYAEKAIKNETVRPVLGVETQNAFLLRNVKSQLTATTVMHNQIFLAKSIFFFQRSLITRAISRIFRGWGGATKAPPLKKNFRKKQQTFFIFILLNVDNFEDHTAFP